MHDFINIASQMQEFINVASQSKEFLGIVFVSSFIMFTGFLYETFDILPYETTIFKLSIKEQCRFYLFALVSVVTIILTFLSLNALLVLK